MAVSTTFPPWQKVVGPPAVAEACATELIVSDTAVLVVLSHPVDILTLAAWYVIVPTILNVGLVTVLPPVAALYQIMVCPAGTVAVAVSVGTGFPGQTVCD